MNSKKNILFAFLLIIFVVSGYTIQNNKYVFAETPHLDQSISETPTQIPNSNDTSKEIELSYIKEFNNKLLDILYFSLSFVAAFLLLFLGTNWFTNIRKIDSEVKRITKELRQEEETKFELLQNELIKKQDLQISILQTEAKKRIEEIISQFKNEIDEMQFNVLTLQAESNKAQGAYNSALMTYTKILKEFPNHGNIPYVIRDMIKIVDDEKKHVFASDTTEISKALSRIPTDHKILIDQLLQSLTNRRS